MARETFQQIVERKKKEGNHRILTEEDMFGGSEGLARFREMMKQVHEDFRIKEWKSWIAVRDTILR